MNLIPGIATSSAGLRAEQLRIEVVGQNIANARTTHTQEGGPYRRQLVHFRAALGDALGSPAVAGPAGTPRGGSNGPSALPQVDVTRDTSAPLRVYQPGHPDADADGYVAYPAISIHEEMADMIAASRAFEANLAVIRNGRALAQQALAIGRR